MTHAWPAHNIQAAECLEDRPAAPSCCRHYLRVAVAMIVCGRQEARFAFTEGGDCEPMVKHLRR
jgi:hypothetical protein